MLIEVKRHGFSFWEAPHRIGPAFEEMTPREVRVNKMLVDFFRNAQPLVDANGKPAKPIREDVTNPKAWGKLVQFADELDPESDEAQAEAQTERMIADIQKRVRGAFGVSWRDFMKSARKEAVWARAASMFLCRLRLKGISMEQIGKAHGSRSYMAVVRAITTSEELRHLSRKFGSIMGCLEAGLLMKAA